MPIRSKAFLIYLAVAVALIATSLVFISPNLEGQAELAATRVRVYADKPWTDTGIDIRPGDRLVIEYVSGEWSPWPGGAYDALGFGGDPRCDCNVILGVSHAALIGRIGEGQPFLVGANYAAVAGETGRLYLGMNDTRQADNSGSIDARVEVPR